MGNYRYLIVGGGMTADAAVRGIREADMECAIGVLSAEPHPPYNRPPLSKGLWKGEAEESIWRGTDALGAELLLGRRAVALDVAGKVVTDDRGEVHSYAKLLLATGGEPRRFPGESEQVFYFRSYQDYQRLRDLATRPLRFAVIGAGFIGSELAAALNMQGRDVVMMFPENGISERLFPPDLSRFLVDYYRDRGVEMRPGVGITRLEARGDHVAVWTAQGEELVVDVVVAGLGIQPNVGLAQQVGLEVANGIVVDELLRTSQPDIYAAGDVANFLNPLLGARLRVEHEDNANRMGQAAGLAMAGTGSPYHHLPFFYSDLFDLGYEAVGELDSRLELVADWKEPFREGVVYYLRDGRVRGVLLWNTWGQLQAARALMAEPGPHSAASLRGRIPG
ncbi:MAG: FAD-dependent oxidoreductase [Gemmatimonadetes bacterium]|nr:FAD-dependent oxidoreductase [Gemmatimonadota bacterium]